MSRPHLRSVIALIHLLAVAGMYTAYAQFPLLPLKPGMAVATCWSFSSDPNFYVVGVIDLRNRTGVQQGKNWAPVAYHGPGTGWTAQKLGKVFGTCFDDEGNMYVAATTVYSYGSVAISFGPAGSGGIYKIDGTTGDITTFASLPNIGTGLGNICFDRDHRQFFVTNFQDGKVYRLGMNGSVLSTFDPYTPYPGLPAEAGYGERLWGVGYYHGRVYYAVWWAQYPKSVPTRHNEIRSVPVNAAGEFIATGDRQELETPFLISAPPHAMVSDIAFSDGKMLLAENGASLVADQQIFHAARVMEYTESNGAWAGPKHIAIGNYRGGIVEPNTRTNAAGGIDYGYGTYNPANDSAQGCDEMIWATGDALMFGGYNPDGSDDLVYGLAGVFSDGNTVANAPYTTYYIDLDNNIRTQNKGLIGDVEIFRYCTTSAALPDTFLLCSDSSVILEGPAGGGWQWTPPAGLSCPTCRWTVANPATTTVYTVTANGPTGSVATDTKVVIVGENVAGLQFISPATIIDTVGQQIEVPVELAIDPGSFGIGRITLTMQYQPGVMRPGDFNDPGIVQQMLKGTVLEGWIVLAHTTTHNPNQGIGSLSLTLGAPPGGRLYTKGELINIPFDTYIGAAELLAGKSLYAITLPFTIALPESPCAPPFADSGHVRLQICGLSTRLIESLAAKPRITSITPNPATGMATITVELEAEEYIGVAMYAATGERVATLAEGLWKAGMHWLEWDARGMPAGSYYCRLRTVLGVQTVQLLVVQ